METGEWRMCTSIDWGAAIKKKQQEKNFNEHSQKI